MTVMLWAIAVMALLNIFMVVLTLGVKTARISHRRRIAARTRELESALGDVLLTGEASPELMHPDARDTDLLATLLIGYLSVLRGEQRERLVALAEEAGLVRWFFRRLRSPSRWRRAQAAENLGYLGGPAAVGPLADLLSYRDETVRAVAARALARVGTPEAAGALAGTLDDPSELTRLRVAENLERIGAVSIPALVGTLKAGAPGARALAARVLGNLRAREARPALRAAVLDAEDDAEGDASPVDLRAQATLALGLVGDPEDVPVLLRASEDGDWPVRAQAANALGRIGETSTIPALQRLTVDREWWVRLNASRSLSNMGPSGEAALARLLEDDDPYARDRAAATLEERGLVRRAAESLTAPGEAGQSARRMVRALAQAGAVRYLGRLSTTLPDAGARDALRRILVEAG